MEGKNPYTLRTLPDRLKRKADESAAKSKEESKDNAKRASSKLNTYKKQVDPHRRLKIGDIVLYSGRGERIPINQYIVCIITQIFGNQRSLKVVPIHVEVMYIVKYVRLPNI